jgi:hypothetical protein
MRASANESEPPEVGHFPTVPLIKASLGSGPRFFRENGVAKARDRKSRVHLEKVSTAK